MPNDEILKTIRLGAMLSVISIKANTEKLASESIKDLTDSMVALYNDAFQHGFLTAAEQVTKNIEGLTNERTSVYQSEAGCTISEQTGVADSGGD